MKKTMPKPVNWQDFEELCKKLWRDIWECPSIKKNGRIGQSQHGVDIWGIPNGMEKYWGIQCKGKDDYTNTQLTINEIDKEIAKAKIFSPQLECFIFTTTANKDSKIEEYVRKKNIESKMNNLFSIDIFSWEDIVDLIEEKKNVYNWYLKDMLHKNNYSLSVCFNGHNDNLTLEPKFKQINLTITKKQVNRNGELKYTNILDTFNTDFEKPSPNVLQAKLIRNAKEYNFSCVQLDIDFFNTGDTAFEYYKVFFTFDDDRIKIDNKNYEYIGIFPDIDISYLSRDFYINENELIYTSNNNRPILIPDDGKRITIYVKCPPDIFEFPIKYKFISKEYSCENQITCSVKPDIEIIKISREAEDGENEEYSENIFEKKYLQEHDE